MDEPRKPYKFNDKAQQKYLGALRRGMRRGKAARAAGVSRPTVWAYEKAHPEFAEACAIAEDDACDTVEDALWLSAVEDRSVMAQLAWLYNRSIGGRWKDRRSQPQNISVTTSQPNIEEIRAELQKLVTEDEAKECTPEDEAKECTPTQT